MCSSGEAPEEKREPVSAAVSVAGPPHLPQLRLHGVGISSAEGFLCAQKKTTLRAGEEQQGKEDEQAIWASFPRPGPRAAPGPSRLVLFQLLDLSLELLHPGGVALGGLAGVALHVGLAAGPLPRTGSVLVRGAAAREGSRGEEGRREARARGRGAEVWEKFRGLDINRARRQGLWGRGRGDARAGPRPASLAFLFSFCSGPRGHNKKPKLDGVAKGSLQAQGAA